MNEKLTRLMNKVIIESGFYDVVDKKEGEIVEEYEQDDEYLNKKKIAHQLSDEDLNKLLSLKMLDYTKSQDEKLKTIKNIIVFWAVLTIIGLIISLYIAYKFTYFISKIY